jgi:uncharacterized protein YkwD
MKRTGAIVVVLALATGAGAQEAVPLKLASEELQLLDLTNQERKKREVPPLRLSLRLCQVARDHAANMARQEKMEHTLDGKTPLDRLRVAGYNFARGGENIAAGDPEASLPAAVMKVWMESPGHRDNILAPVFTEIGLGMARDSAGRIYYAQVFARPRTTE